MKTSKNGVKFIAQWEGLYLNTYKDVAGVLTIGYGHTSSAGAPKVVPGMTITKDEAENILANDLGKVEADVNRLVKVKLTQNQFDALVSFHFNTGALAKSSALKYLNEGNYEQAAKNLTLYNKARVGGQLQTVKGLVNRREAERKLFLTEATNTTSNVAVSTGGTVVAGGAAAVTSPTDWMPYIVGVVVVIGVAWTFYSLIRSYLKQKEKINAVLPKTEDK